ncbi:FliO/MopB family protein [Halarsenatibacter silvermanii]|uniref:Flagellar biosynthesis protein, FliO n=1 Tax=Halarsenatibacter silvermanii TaxID=321763 RepID=A0A1G9MJM8_9FIRM|nr:flagellar biosynthetic protein FliO [Halarsenatibacter silvermanii]SDL74107.1 Flagellar biosynthesis protein, FliO [Halarsenatibacter silvermanii]
MDYGFELVRVFFYLLLVLGIIFFGQKYFRRFMRRQQQGEHMQIIEQLYLSPKKNLTLVRTRDEVLLIVIYEEGVKKLNSWPREDFELEKAAGSMTDAEEQKSFSERIKERLNFYGRGEDE